MNQGHSFFAPDVGPGHVVRYELQYAGGQTTQSELPSRKEQWPRLFYHRHMMLADQSDMPTDDKQMSDRWQRKYLQAFGRHLLRVNENAQSVRLQRIAHWPLPRELAEKGTAITDPQGYDLLVEVTVRRSELGPEASEFSPAQAIVQLAKQSAQRGEPRTDRNPPMIAAVRDYFAELWDAWDGFWFTPSSPSTLSAIRVLAGAMLLYTHLVWSLGLVDFFGQNGWLPQDLMKEVHAMGSDPDGAGPLVGTGRLIWSHFNYVHSPNLMWTIHIVALVVFFFFTIGFFSRTMALLAFLFAVSYANRVTPGAILRAR